MATPLSKSDYMLFLRHPAYLWLKKYAKAKLPLIDENTQEIFDKGHEFESYAEKLYPKAVKLGFKSYDEYLQLPAKTQTTLATAEAILQGRFEAEGITCIVDVLNKLTDDEYELIEIKSSTKVKTEYFYDLAFQAAVLEKSGVKVKKFGVVYVNTDYVRQGSIEPEKITTYEEVTEDVLNLMELTESQIEEAFEVISQRTCPDLSPRYANKLGVSGTSWFQDWLSVYKHLNPRLDPYSIYFLSSPSPEQLAQLEDTDVTLIKDVPEEMALRPRQLSQIIAARDDARTIESDKIKQFIEGFEYPIYFFDYETMSSVIPAFDGFKPYKDYPFQYSLHILDRPGGSLTHKEFLHAQNTNPMPDLLKQLVNDIGPKGTVLAWNMSYEKSCNDTMVDYYPEYADFLADLNERMEDLKTPFSEMWFVDKDFFGSASIKDVLPVLAPDLNYKDLDVSDGLKARRIWTNTVVGGENAAERGKILKDLKEYCELDTFAMVRILEELGKITKQL